jgi:RNA polymerase sigma-70 factor (ECF subfamily)
VSTEAAGDGDLAAFYARAYPRLVGLLTLIGGSRPDAEEIAQEAFARLLLRWDKVSGYEDPAGWLRTVAVRMLISRRRRQQVATLGLARLAGRASGAQPDVADAAGDRFDVLAALDRLPAPQRAAVVLHHLLDLPVDLVAAELGVAVGTVKSRLSRARTALAEDLSTDRVNGNV